MDLINIFANLSEVDKPNAVAIKQAFTQGSVNVSEYLVTSEAELQAVCDCVFDKNYQDWGGGSHYTEDAIPSLRNGR